MYPIVLFHQLCSLYIRGEICGYSVTTYFTLIQIRSLALHLGDVRQTHLPHHET